MVRSTSVPQGVHGQLVPPFCKCHEGGQQDPKSNGLVWVAFASVKISEL